MGFYGIPEIQVQGIPYHSFFFGQQKNLHEKHSKSWNTTNPPRLVEIWFATVDSVLSNPARKPVGFLEMGLQPDFYPLNLV